MKSRMSILFLVAATFGLRLPSVGAQSAPTVAVIDVAKVFEQYQMTGDLEAYFDTQQKAVADQRDARRKELEAKRKELEAFMQNTPDYKDRYNQLVRMEVDFQVWLGIQERTLKDEHMHRLRQIYDDVRAAVKGVCEPRGIDLVLTYDQIVQDAPDSAALRQQILLQKVIYASGRVDVTTDVLTAVNEAYRLRGGIESLKLGDASPPSNANDLEDRMLVDATVQP